jgi:MFS family permease
VDRCLVRRVHGLSGFTHSYPALYLTRALQGLGFGGEWAVGSVLIAETIPARHRGKAAGLVQSSWAIGWAAAALAYGGLYALMPAELAWRVLFWLGIAPALLIVYVRRRVPESPVYIGVRERARRGALSGYFHPAALPHDRAREPVVRRDDGGVLRGEHMAADVSFD